MLDELEAIHNVALVGGEKKATAVDRLPRGTLRWSDFWAELDTATKNTASLGRYRFWLVFQIRSRVGLPSMRCKGASVLCCLITGEGVTEVVVSFLVLRDGKIVMRWCEIDRCSYTPLSEQGSRVGDECR